VTRRYLRHCGSPTLCYRYNVLPIWLLVPLALLATHRITRLITRDAIPLIAIPREAFAQRWATFADAKTSEERRTSIGGKRTNIVMSSLAYLWECDWCTSAYVGAGIAVASYHWFDELWFQYVLLAVAASSIAGLIAQREPD